MNKCENRLKCTQFVYVLLFVFTFQHVFLYLHAPVFYLPIYSFIFFVLCFLTHFH